MPDIREYAKLGLVHHLLYPRSTSDRAYHIETLSQMVEREDIECLDCCIPYGEEFRTSGILEKGKNCGKDVAYALHLFPLRKISLASLDLQEQEFTKLILLDQIEMAAKIGAAGFVFASGADQPSNRPAAQEAFRNFCRWFCTELKKYDIDALLEPFDRTIDKKFLYGPTEDCIDLIQDLHGEGIDNIGIELDMAHLPLMFEDFEGAIMRCAPYTKRIHLGNCVLKDPTHPLYGDQHPPMGLEGGEIDVPELKRILQALYDTGYLSKTCRKPLIMEMQPFPGKSVEYTVAETVKRVETAFQQVVF